MHEAVAQIITKIVLEGVPKFMRASRVATNHDDDKETAEVGSSAHILGFLQALNPFPIIIQQTSELACILERIADSTIDSTKVFIGGSTFEKYSELA
jgi:hypothetical protein